MATVKVNLKDGSVIEEVVSDAMDKMELQDRLKQDDVRVRFVDATIQYDNGGTDDNHSHHFTDLDEFINELGKFGG